MFIKPLPEATYLRGVFDYNPNTGDLVWKTKETDVSIVGEVAGFRTKSGISVTLRGEQYKVHRLIWKWMTGEDPPVWIDHENGDEFDNSWGNLRLATAGQNKMNSRTSDNNKLGVKGIYRSRSGCFVAKLRANGRLAFYLRCGTLEEAKAAYAAAVIKHHQEYGRTE